MVKHILAILAGFGILAGCSQVAGRYYLETGQYKEGIVAMQATLEEDAGDASAAWHLGRYWLALDDAEKALPYFDQALRADAGKAEYHFWQGVALWKTGQRDKELAAYERALVIDPAHIPANLYLAHGRLEQGEKAAALTLYNAVLKRRPFHSSALYNRAVALDQLDRNEDAIKAYDSFLLAWPDGAQALATASRLNALGNFDWRNHIIGQRNVTLRGPLFAKDSSILGFKDKESLQLVAAMLSDNKDQSIHIAVFVDGNTSLAKARSQAIRDYILLVESDIGEERLLLSWFGEAEPVTSRYKTRLAESVRFINASSLEGN